MSETSKESTFNMMRKKTTYTNITPIPSYIPRQLAVDILHSHSEIIELNPLVTGHKPIKAPRDAPSDEFYSTWYEISQRIQYVPGMGKLGSGKINFNGCFHDMPWGLQTHIYAPAGVDLRNKWQIRGNQPGEAPETHELGIGAPPEGLYLREDIEIKCNVTMVSFVKKETKAASKILVERLIKKAELLDSGALQAMMENGKLKTINPADRSSTMPPGSPHQPSHSPHPPNSPNPYNAPMSPKMPYHMPQSPRRSPTFPQAQSGDYSGYQQQQQQQQQYFPPNHSQGHNGYVMELPGDYPSASQGQPSPNHLHPSNRYSSASEGSGYSPNMNDGRWSSAPSEYQSSMSSRPSSYASEGIKSPGLEQRAFAAELPTMNETREEHDGSEAALKRLEGGEGYGDDKRQKQERRFQEVEGDRKYRYNPQDFAKAQDRHQQAPPQYSQYGHPQNHPQR